MLREYSFWRWKVTYKVRQSRAKESLYLSRRQAWQQRDKHFMRRHTKYSLCLFTVQFGFSFLCVCDLFFSNVSILLTLVCSLYHLTLPISPWSGNVSGIQWGDVKLANWRSILALLMRRLWRYTLSHFGALKSSLFLSLCGKTMFLMRNHVIVFAFARDQNRWQYEAAEKKITNMYGLPSQQSTNAGRLKMPKCSAGTSAKFPEDSDVRCPMGTSVS